MTAGYSQTLSAFHFHFVKLCWSFPGTIETGPYLARRAWNQALAMDCVVPPGRSQNTHTSYRMLLFWTAVAIYRNPFCFKRQKRGMFRSILSIGAFCQTKLNLSKHCRKATHLEAKPLQIRSVPSASAAEQKITGWVLSCKALLLCSALLCCSLLCYCGSVPPCAQGNLWPQPLTGAN